MNLPLKRPRTLLGDVLEVKMDGNSKRYLQYIGFDKSALGLGGDVVRIFKKTYKKESTPLLKEITEGEVDFYAHIHSVTKGIKEGLWSRVGSIKKDIGVEKPLFYQYSDNKWFLWEMDGKNYWEATKKEIMKSSANMGGVMPPKLVEERIKAGKYLIGDPTYIK